MCVFEGLLLVVVCMEFIVCPHTVVRLCVCAVCVGDIGLLCKGKGLFILFFYGHYLQRC